MLDGDSPNLDSFLPFSLREVAIARAFLNGKHPHIEEPNRPYPLHSLSLQTPKA